MDLPPPQMALEKATQQSRLRTEVSRAKREADHFKQGVEKGKRMEKAAKKRKGAAAAAQEAAGEKVRKKNHRL